MLSKQQIEALKKIPIVDYLASTGHLPESQSGTEFRYYSPLRLESTPSFFVNSDKNVFHDFGGEKGDIIRLVGLVQRLSFPEACNYLQETNLSETGPLPIIAPSKPLLNPDRPSEGIQLIKTIQLTNPALINYAESRRIPFLLAAKYCKEVHYENAGRKYFSLGFRSDKGGYELRNKIGSKEFKGCIAPKGVTTFLTSHCSTISIFEGFFDFLSALTYFNVSVPHHSVIVLNSTSNLSDALPLIGKYKQIFTYLDNDKAGFDTVKKLKSRSLPIIDKSSIYIGYKDFSEMICANKI